MKIQSIPLGALFCVTVLGAAGVPAHAQVAGADYAVQQRWSLGAAGKWDYADVDPVRHRLFLTRGERVDVLDLPTGKLVGSIAPTAGVHGVAFAQDLKLGYTSNGRSDSVTVFDLDTLKVTGEIKVSGGNPDAILYETQTRRLYTFNGKTSNVTVIDAPTSRVISTIAVGGRPEFAVSDHAGRIFLNIEDKSEIDVIDTASAQVVARWPLAGCDEPSGIAMDVARARLFSVCQNGKMMVTDARTGKNVATVKIGAHPDAVIYDAQRATVLSSNGGAGGSLTVIHQQDADHYAVAAQVATEQGAKTMAMDPASHAVYLPAAHEQVFTVLVLGTH